MPNTVESPNTIFQQALKQARRMGAPAQSTRQRLEVLDGHVAHWRHWRPDSFHHIAAGLAELAARHAFLLASIEAEAARTCHEVDLSGLTLDMESMIDCLDVNYLLADNCSRVRTPGDVLRFAETRFYRICRKWAWLMMRMATVHVASVPIYRVAPPPSARAGS